MKQTTETPSVQLTPSDVALFRARYTAEPDFKRLFDMVRSLPPEKVLKAAELVSGIIQRNQGGNYEADNI